MLTETQIGRMLSKLRRFEDTLEPLIFEKVDELGSVEAYETEQSLYDIPKNAEYKAAKDGFKWGGESHYCWFKADYTVPAELDGKMLFIRPHIGGYEAMLWVDGVPFGTFATKIVFTGHGNHYCDMFKKKAKAGEKIALALEYYAGHSYKGCAPLEDLPLLTYDFTYHGCDICIKNKEISDYYFDLHTLNSLVKSLPADSARRGDIINALYKVHNEVYYSADDVDRKSFIAALKKTHPYLKEALSKKNGDTACRAGVIGHSHMDTAWLWHVGETVKKCARTYANQTSLMEQYPEYKFVQSSALHSEFVREHYPELFKRIQKYVKEGRYEPNGAVWVECDCNITSGESMVRQFLWGQRFTRKYFNYTSNCFWLPDTFGYSAAIPQIMKGCGVDYFLTTKIDWNDTNKFPFQTFWWEGIDGTRVFSHFNKTHTHPDPEKLIELVEHKQDGLLEKNVSRDRLIAYGFGDGGGGPQFEMIEEAKRCKDLDGCPKAEHTTVGEFMQKLEKEAVEPSVFKGELYLELHRGTLTNQHNIKRNNRKCELALRDVEILTVDSAVKNGAAADSKEIAPLYKTLLQNQFHDILPGTCIPRAHKESKEQTGAILASCADMKAKFTSGSGKNQVTVTNTLSFDRSDAVIFKVKKGYIVDGDYAQQKYTNLDGDEMLILSGLTVPAFSSVTLTLKKGEPEGKKVFKSTATALETPFAKVKFDKKGRITSFFDKCARRELAGEGYPLNTLLVAEDLPSAWDNWDVDADIETKFRDCSELISREVVSLGAAAAVIRSEYKLTEKSTVKQDMIFFADSKEVRFDTLMNWNDDHRFLKAAFDTDIRQDFARFEIQFGYAKRPTTRNNSVEKAKFEVLNHKYTDLSETRFGVAILNDCKYAISVDGGKMRLSLHKGGTRPDFTGDHGEHRCTYSFLPHCGDFSAKTVTQPAYELNVPCVVSEGEFKLNSLVKPAESNIIVECIKPCEDTEKAFIVRMYECEGAFTNCALNIFDGAKRCEITNMLEESQSEIALDGAEVTFRPFEIKTLKISY